MKSEESKVISYSLLIISGILITQALIFTKSILVPFVFSIFVYASFAPLCKKLENKLKVPHMTSILIGIFLMTSAIICVVVAVGFSLQNFIEDAGKYQRQIANLLDQIKIMALQWGVPWDIDDWVAQLKNIPVVEILKNATGSFLSIIGNLFLIVVFSMFLLLGDGKMASPHRTFEEIQDKIARYVNTKFLISIVTASMVGLVLLLFGVEMAFLFAILTFFLNFIPNIGSLLALALPVPILLLQFGLTLNFWLVMILTGIIQMVIGNIVEPKLMGESMELHPIVVLLFLMFWGVVWGLPGMFLAVPISATLKIVLSRFNITRPMANWMAGNF